jgi:hypothetical protein
MTKIIKPFNPPIKKHPQGMILAFTLMILLLMSLMGAAILVSTRNEINITGNTRVSRDAFALTDTAARIATLMGRIIVHPELGSPEQVLSAVGSPRFPVDVSIESSFNLGALKQEAVTGNNTIEERYMNVGVGIAGKRNDHMVFGVGSKKAAFARFALDSESPIGDGTSLGSGDRYDNSGGSLLQVVMVISVKGTSPNFSGGSGIENEPTSVVTTIYREVM